MDWKVQTEQQLHTTQLFASDKSRPSLPSTLKTSEEEFSNISGNTDLSSSRRSFDIGNHSDKQLCEPYQTEQEEDYQDANSSKTMTIEIQGNIHRLNVITPNAFEEALQSIAHVTELEPFTMLCMKVVLVKQLKTQNYRFDPLYKSIMQEYMQYRFERLLPKT